MVILFTTFFHLVMLKPNSCNAYGPINLKNTDVQQKGRVLVVVSSNYIHALSFWTDNYNHVLVEEKNSVVYKCFNSHFIFEM